MGGALEIVTLKRQRAVPLHKMVMRIGEFGMRNIYSSGFIV